MTDRPISKVAAGVAVGTMAYLALAVFAFAVRSPALNLVLLPGYFLLISAAPILAVVGLSAGGWLIAEPNTAGFVLLIALYTTGAYFLAPSNDACGSARMPKHSHKPRKDDRKRTTNTHCATTTEPWLSLIACRRMPTLVHAAIKMVDNCPASDHVTYL